jgi:sugar O-acyltransferase (sialic acid O-acetyltransferase NeuD family)
MKDIAIYGAGGLGREVYCMLQSLNKEKPLWNVIGFFDDGIPIGNKNEYGSVIGGINELNDWKDELSVVMAIGSGKTVKAIVDKIINDRISFPNIMNHPFLADDNNLKVGKGNIVARDCSFSCAVKIGDFNLFNGSIVFGHDVHVGNFNTFMPAVRVSGEVEIGDENFFGVGSIILQQIRISNKVRIGAGSVLMHKPKEGQLYMGNPAKLFRY